MINLHIFLLIKQLSLIGKTLLEINNLEIKEISRVGKIIGWIISFEIKQISLIGINFNLIYFLEIKDKGNWIIIFLVSFIVLFKSSFKFFSLL